MENSVRKITSAAAWLVSASISTGWPSACASSRATAACPAVSMAGYTSRRRPPSKAGSMIRRCRFHVAIGDENRIAQQRRQPFADTVGFWEIIGAVFQHQIDQFGLVAQERPEKWCAKLGHPSPIQMRRLRRQDVLPKQFHIAP